MNNNIDITQYTRELEQLAGQLRTRYELTLSVRKLCSAGYEMLQELASSGKYDSARGEFWAWAYIHVQRRMIDEVALHGGRSRRLQAARRNNLAASVSAWPMADQGKRALFDRRVAVVHTTYIGYQLELDAPETMNPEEQLLAAERKQFDDAATERMLAGLKRLPARQRKMLIQRHVEDNALNAVAADHGISKSRASHLLKAAKEKLRLAVARGLER